MRRVALLCQGATEATRAVRFAADEPLDAKGRTRLDRRPPPLPAYERCILAPTRAAAETATALGLAGSTEPALRDLDCGRWAGRALADIEQDEPAALAAWLGDPAAAPHGGEPLSDLLARVGAWLDGLEQGPGPVLAVAAAAVVRGALVHALGAAPASFWRIDVAPLALASLAGRAGSWRFTALSRP